MWSGNFATFKASISSAHNAGYDSADPGGSETELLHLFFLFLEIKRFYFYSHWASLGGLKRHDSPNF